MLNPFSSNESPVIPPTWGDTFQPQVLFSVLHFNSHIHYYSPSNSDQNHHVVAHTGIQLEDMKIRGHVWNLSGTQLRTWPSYIPVSPNTQEEDCLPLLLFSQTRWPCHRHHLSSGTLWLIAQENFEGLLNLYCFLLVTISNFLGIRVTIELSVFLVIDKWWIDTWHLLLLTSSIPFCNRENGKLEKLYLQAPL